MSPMPLPVFINSAMVRAPERLVLRGGRWAFVDIPVRYGLWQHPRLGPVLIDTGYTRRVTQGSGRSLAMKLYASALRPRLLYGGSPLEQLESRGIHPADVGHIVITHFHADHIAALADFPAARFLADGAAFQQLSRMSTRQQWHNGFFPELLPADFHRRLVPIEAMASVPLPRGLGSGYDLFADGSCLAVPLPGHALGHFGLLWPDPSPRLLYATDVQWLRQAITEERAPGGPAQLIYSDRRAAMASMRKVKAFVEQGGQLVLCHDPDHAILDGEAGA